MRNFGFILLVAGVVGYFYCSSQASELEPLDPGLSIADSFATDRGKWDTGRYAAAAAAFMGLALTMVPQRR